jgi:protein-L-isoaspartate(D-aspartate) O-methyltransferase
MVNFEAARAEMVRFLRAEIHDERVLAAFAQVPREHFVAQELQPYAYEDRALPISRGQTISQPLIVAMMTQALQLTGDEKVLEIGTGSGYQAAILSLLAREVVTLERIPELTESARQRLQALGYRNVRVEQAGEALGWPQGAPYDAIIVTAGAPAVPQSLVDQLAEGGRMVAPVGSRRLQQLVRATKAAYGVTLEQLGECRFVPLIAPKEGWPEWVSSENGVRPVA